jgi:ribonuclease HII
MCPCAKSARGEPSRTPCGGMGSSMRGRRGRSRQGLPRRARVAGAVILDPERHIPGLADSKALTEPPRSACSTSSSSKSRGVVRGVSRTGGDRPINIHQATLRAMRRAVLALPPARRRPGRCLPHPGLPMAQRGVVKGDRQCAAIAAASIIAKVTRDRLMTRCIATDPATASTGTRATPRPTTWPPSPGSAIPAHRRSFRPPTLFEGLIPILRADHVPRSIVKGHSKRGKSPAPGPH